MEEQYIQPNPISEQLDIHNQAQQGTSIAENNKRMQYQMEEVEKNLAESQLDCKDILIEWYHKLRQDVQKIDEEKGIFDWFPVDDEKKRILTDVGVDKFMEILSSYINKETLLSNFDVDTINRRMLEFSLSVSALILLKYEFIFRVVSIDEASDILKLSIENKVKREKLTCEIGGKEFDEEATRKKIQLELVTRMEYELGKIQEEKRKVNLREFESLFTQMKHIVESTHNRAWKGEERGSLRRHFNISEVIGGGQQQQQKQKRWGLF